MMKGGERVEGGGAVDSFFERLPGVSLVLACNSRVLCTKPC